MATTNDILGTTADISKVLADYERQRALGDVTQAGVNQNQANTANNLYRTQAQFALDGPSISAAQAAKGDAQANVQPFAWTGGTKMVGNIPVPQSTGGLNPGVFGPNARQAGQKLAALGNSRVLSPTFNLPSAPSLAPVPTASGLDKTLSTASVIGNVLGALNHGQTGPTAQDPSGNGGNGPGGSGGSFSLPFSGFKSFFGHGGNTENTGMTYNPPPSSITDPSQGTGIGPGMQGLTDSPTNPTSIPGLDPSQNNFGQVEDPMTAYLAWLQSQQGGSDGTYGDNP